MRRRLEQLRGLAPWEWRLLAQLVLLLPAIGAALHLLGFKRTRDLLGRLSPLSTPTEQLDTAQACAKAQRIARLLRIAANHGLYRATCLRQSLALWWLLKRRGIPAELRIGVRKDGAGLNAHAWVEFDGTPLGRENLGYVPFAGLSSATGNLG